MADPFLLTQAKVRHLTAADLGRAPVVAPVEPPIDEITPLEPDDPILLTVQDLLQSYGGVIFVGPPGTSKSWYAARVGLTLVEGDQTRLRFVQFHPSYQYEDFVEGFIPEQGGGFRLAEKHFLELSRRAEREPDKAFVLVIDELSRGDPGRVFGEALTYVERSKRGLKFNLASGTECSVPSNLVVLATMNPLDRGVDEVDAALERRFAKYALDPDPQILSELVSEAGMADALRIRLMDFFAKINRRARSNPFASLGHTYFAKIEDEDGLRRVWDHQLRFHFDKAYRLDPDGKEAVFRLWDRVLEVGGAEAAEPIADEPEATA